MKKALIFIDFDMLIRHFVMSGAFQEIERKFNVTYVVQIDTTTEKTTIDADIDALNLPRVIRIEVPRARMGAWDKLYCVTTLSNQRGTKNYRKRRHLIADVRGWVRTLYFELLSLPGIFPLAKRKIINDLGVYMPIEKLLLDERPEIVIHPSILAGYFVNELAQLCPRLGIPFLLLMNSWDNPSTKSMNTGLPTRLAVWGPQTRAHAIEYMKIPPDRVVEMGAAQFDVYRESITESDRDLRRLFGVPTDVPIILYAGVSKSVDETTHLLEIDRMIESGQVPRCHILYRPHPWRGRLVPGEKSFFDVSFSNVSFDPFMEEFYRRIVEKPQRSFELADYRVTAKLLRMVSGVISPLSTMLLEATMHGIPVIMYFDSNDGSGSSAFIDLAAKLPHFAEFWGPEGIQIARNSRELLGALERLLREHLNDRVSAGLRAHSAKYVVMDGPRYRERLAALAEELTAERAR